MEGSPDKSQRTEISLTEKQDRAQVKKVNDMCERVVRDDWLVYKREWVCFGKKIAQGGQAEIYAAAL